ncbi:MAG: nuclear transport factor 2 family protein [Candidatus Limnocylindria bacterium]
MTRSDVQAWLDRYIEAWRLNQRELVEALFTEDATYRWRPYGGEDRRAQGLVAIVDGWLDQGDEPGSWEAEYEPYAVDGDRAAAATGYSRYFASADEPERTYHNVFLLRFADDGRCSEFTEYYMLEEE